MFTTDGDVNNGAVNAAVSSAEGNYKIQIDDKIEVKIYTNGGELIIDPTQELRKDVGGNSAGNMDLYNPQYLVQQDGTVKLPMIGIVDIEGLTIRQSDSLLATKYEAHYEDVYVITKVVNRRVIVLGPLGGKVIPIENENTNLIEVLAIYGGLDNFSKAHNIRLIRGDLKDPEVHVINLSSIATMKQSELTVRTKDIIYIEPLRKGLNEAIKDISPVISLFASLVTLTIFVTR